MRINMKVWINTYKEDPKCFLLMFQHVQSQKEMTDTNWWICIATAIQALLQHYVSLDTLHQSSVVYEPSSCLSSSPLYQKFMFLEKTASHSPYTSPFMSYSGIRDIKKVNLAQFLCYFYYPGNWIMQEYI